MDREATSTTAVTHFYGAELLVLPTWLYSWFYLSD
jgi:hypothetical protein